MRVSEFYKSSKHGLTVGSLLRVADDEKGQDYRIILLSCEVGFCNRKPAVVGLLDVHTWQLGKRLHVLLPELNSIDAFDLLGPLDDWDVIEYEEPETGEMIHYP